MLSPVCKQGAYYFLKLIIDYAAVHRKVMDGKGERVTISNCS